VFDLLQDPAFGTTFDFILELDADFGANFTFNDAFGGSSVSSELFKHNNIYCEFSAEHMLQLQQCRRCKKCNQTAHIAKRA
jgi:hypothetical protein